MSSACSDAILLALEPLLYNVDDTIVRRDSAGECMFFVTHGTVALKDGTELAVGEHFGATFFHLLTNFCVNLDSCSATTKLSTRALLQGWKLWFTKTTSQP